MHLLKKSFFHRSRTASDTRLEEPNIVEAPAASVGHSAPGLVLGRSRTTSGVTGWPRDGPGMTWGMTGWPGTQLMGEFLLYL